MKILRSLPLLAALFSAGTIGCSKQAEKPVSKAAVESLQIVQGILERQEPRYKQYEPLITEDALREDLTFLASDEMRGRLAGQKLLEVEVTKYIENIFEKAGLKKPFNNGTSYRQPFIIDWENRHPTGYRVDERPIKPGYKTREVNPRQFYYVPHFYTDVPSKGLSRDAIKTHNLVGILEGQDETLKNQYMLVCAHMDAVGIDTLAEAGEDFICNGANDNASGVSVVLSVIRTLAQASKEGNGPKRSLIVLFSSAEEMGTLGSWFFINNLPIDLKQIQAAINIDMVGGLDSSSISVLDSYNKGTPSFFHIYHDAIAKGTGIEHIFHDIESLRDRGDHDNFANKSIPFIFISQGLTSNGEETDEDYHAVSDEVRKINFRKLQSVSRFSYRLLWVALN